MKRFIKTPYSKKTGSVAGGTAGFTLVEMLVAVSVFTVVMLAAAGSLLSIIAADRKAQAFKSVMNNLNYAMEGMTRTIRVGTDYQCQVRDCATQGSTRVEFEESGGDPNDTGDNIIYQLNGNQIERSSNGGATFVSVTAPEVVVESLRFFVDGNNPTPDQEQPSVLIVVKGHAGISDRAQTDFSIQTFVSQRLPDE